jgi:hypothetical protein
MFMVKFDFNAKQNKGDIVLNVKQSKRQKLIATSLFSSLSLVPYLPPES